MSSVAERIDDPSLCVIHIGKGERITGLLGELLNPVNSESFHEYRLPPNSDVELHYHDYDEYWLFTAGTPKVTLRLPDGDHEDSASLSRGIWWRVCEVWSIRYGRIMNWSISSFVVSLKVESGVGNLIRSSSG